MATLKKHRVLILGVSGFLGGVIYRELHPYFQTFGTYKTSKSVLKKKHIFISMTLKKMISLKY